MSQVHFIDIFFIEVNAEEAKKLTVVFRVYDWDHFKKSDEIGEVIKITPFIICHIRGYQLIT